MIYNVKYLPISINQFDNQSRSNNVQLGIVDIVTGIEYSGEVGTRAYEERCSNHRTKVQLSIDVHVHVC